MSVLYLEGRGDLGKGQSIPDLESEISQSDKGLQLSWFDLNKLGENLDQVIDIVLIGCLKNSGIRRFDKDVDMYAACEIVIEMVDSTYWFLHSKSEGIMCKFESAKA